MERSVERERKRNRESVCACKRERRVRRVTQRQGERERETETATATQRQRHRERYTIQRQIQRRREKRQHAEHQNTKDRESDRTGNGSHLRVDDFLCLVSLALVKQLANTGHDLEAGSEGVRHLLADKLCEHQTGEGVVMKLNEWNGGKAP